MLIRVRFGVEVKHEPVFVLRAGVGCLSQNAVGLFCPQVLPGRVG